MKKYAVLITAVCLTIISCQKENQSPPSILPKKGILQIKDLVSGNPLTGIVVRRGSIVADQFVQKDSFITDQQGKIIYDRSDNVKEAFRVTAKTYFMPVFLIPGVQQGNVLEPYFIPDEWAFVPGRNPKISGDSTFFEINMIKKVPVKIKLKQQQIYVPLGLNKVIFSMSVFGEDPAIQGEDVVSTFIPDLELDNNSLLEKEYDLLLGGDLLHTFRGRVYSTIGFNGYHQYWQSDSTAVRISSTSNNEILVTF